MPKIFTYPITIDTWKNTPVFAGRLATKEDVDRNRAMFCTIEAEGKLCEIDLPFCAIYTEKKTQEKFSIIAVQAEASHNEAVIGAVKMSGESMVCLLSELEIVKDPDQVFFLFTKKTLVKTFVKLMEQNLKFIADKMRRVLLQPK